MLTHAKRVHMYLIHTYECSKRAWPRGLKGTKMVQVEEVETIINEMKGVVPPRRPTFRGRTVLPRFMPRMSESLAVCEPKPENARWARATPPH